MPNGWVHVCKLKSATDHGAVDSSYSTHGIPAVHDDESRARASVELLWISEYEADSAAQV